MAAEAGEKAVKKWIRRVRSCPKSERKAAALAVARCAREGSDPALDELCRMAAGRGRGLAGRYSAEDQLIGIAALGMSGRREARRLLESWREYREVYVESCTGLACGSDRIPQWTALAYTFHKAPRRLAEKLCYNGPTSPPGVPPGPLTPAGHAERRAENPYHAAIDRAIARLAAAAAGA